MLRFYTFVLKATINHGNIFQNKLPFLRLNDKIPTFFEICWRMIILVFVDYLSIHQCLKHHNPITQKRCMTRQANIKESELNISE